MMANTETSGARLGDENVVSIRQPEAGSQFAALYNLWRHFEADRDLTEDEQRLEQRMHVQSVIMTQMEAMGCRSLEDVLYKLAIWRWEALDIDIDTADRSERLAYSALVDIARLTGNSWILSEHGLPLELRTIGVREKTPA